MPNLTQQDINEISIALELNGAKNNIEIREALEKVLLDVSNISSGSFYRANVTQTSTSAPTASVKENTLGGTPVWARTGIGEYTLTLTGAFGAADTDLFVIAGQSQDSNLETVVAYWNDANSITVESYNSSGVIADGVLGNTPIEIRIY